MSSNLRNAFRESAIVIMHWQKEKKKAPCSTGAMTNLASFAAVTCSKTIIVKSFVEIILHFHHFNITISIQRRCQHDSSSWRQSMAPFVSYEKTKIIPAERRWWWKSQQRAWRVGFRAPTGSEELQVSFNVLPEAVQILLQPISLSISISLSRSENWV